MFANLKKKIEEEVGDLGRLASPLTSFGNLDRRVSGSSTQGTNTPGLGSRQSSVASLIDTVDHRNHSSGPILTPRNAHSSSASSDSNDHQHANEIKKLNQEWHRKFEQQRKTYEEKLQTQELDFAWKYNSKDEDIEKLRQEKRRFEEQIKSLEGGYHQKLTRVQEDIDQLEGFSKQENAKIKHLLLNTQEELSQLKSQLFNKDQELKQSSEENKSLRSENENLHKNLDKITAKQSTSSSIDFMCQTKDEPESQSCQYDNDKEEIQKLTRNLHSTKDQLSELEQVHSQSISNHESVALGLKTTYDSQLAQIQSKFDNLVVQKSKLELELAQANGKLQSEIQDRKMHAAKIQSELKDTELKWKDLLESTRMECEQRLQSNEEKSTPESNELVADLQSEIAQLQAELNQMQVMHRNELESTCEELEKFKQMSQQYLNEKPELLSRLDFLGDLLKNKNSEFERKKSECDELLRKKSELENEVETVSLELEKFKLEQENHWGELQSEYELKIMTLKDNHEGELNQIKSDLDLERDQHSGLQQRVTVENTKLTEVVNDLRKTLEGLEAKHRLDIEKLKNELHESASEYREIEKDKSDLEIELARLIKTFNEKSNKQKSEYEEKIIELKTNLGGVENVKITELLENNGAFRSTISSLESELNQVCVDVAHKSLEIEQLKIGNSKLETENNELILQVSEVQAKVDEMEEELLFVKEQADQQNRRDEQEKLENKEIALLQERIKELEMLLQEKNKALKLRQQQLQDLRKSLAKELKSSAMEASGSLVTNSTNSNSTAATMEEVSLLDEHLSANQQTHELQLNHHHDNSISQPASLPPYETDVNFQYLRSVVFKYLTSHDQQVTHHLTRVVATLLHLTEEEQHLLSQSTESRISWISSILHKP